MLTSNELTLGLCDHQISGQRELNYVGVELIFFLT